MKFYIFFILIIVSFPDIVPVIGNEPVRYGKLDILITGFKNENGKCWFAIDNSKRTFESGDSVFISKILKIENNQVFITIDSLMKGEYAIKVFHDENDNEILDKNFLGIPIENYGFSNNASAWFGPPDWENAKFYFGADQMKIQINID